MRAAAEAYSVPELRRLIRDALAQVGRGSVITQVSGPGTGYSRQIVLTPQEAVELYQLALDYKLGQMESPILQEHFFDPGTAC